MSVDRFTAVSAFRAALDMPDAADWRAIAESLAAVMPAVRAPKPDASAGPAWWHTAPLPKHFETQSVELTFADREVVRCEMHRAPGKPWQVERATRVAVAFWRARQCKGWDARGMGDGPVPAVTLMYGVDTAETWCAETVSRLSEAFRAPLPPLSSPRPAVTPEKLEYLRAELVRRRAGLAAVEVRAAELHAARASGDTVRFNAAMKAARTDCEPGAWRAAVAGIESELAALAPAPAPLDWCEAVAEAYAAPAEAECAGTFDAPAMRLDSAAMSIFTASNAVEKTDTLIPAASIVGPDLNVPPVEATEQPAPVEATGSENGPDLSTDAENASVPAFTESASEYAPADDWRPSTATHPVIVYCLSERARAELFERVQDGTWPAAGCEAKGGAWRLTLADALDLQGLKSARFTGMPRKAYTRRPAAPPVEAIPAPAEAIPSFVPSPAFIPGAAYPDGAIVLHQPAL